MSRKRHPHHRLTDLMVRKAGPGRYADGNCLYLWVEDSRAKRWVQRLVILGKRRDLGLGSYPLVPLADARRVAAENRRIARAGGDPCVVRTPKSVPLLRDVVEEVSASRRRGWKTDKNEQKWRRYFRDLVYPEIGDDVAVDKITLDDVKGLVGPHWHGRRSRGYVLRQYLDVVLDWAMISGHRSDNPAAKVKALLKEAPAQVVYYPSLPYSEAPEALRKVQGVACDPAVKLALVFMVLTAARISEVTEAPWSEIDLPRRTWVCSAARLKKLVRHRVPLSDQAIGVLEQAKALGRSGSLAFPTPHVRTGGVRSVTANDFRQVLRPLGFKDEENRPIVMHGFRATLGEWAQEVAKAPEEQREKALAHSAPTSTKARYGRSDLLELRRPLMQAWADYVLPRG